MNILIQESMDSWLNEAIIISDKTISIDLNDFLSGKYDKLFVIGLVASGKTTLGHKLGRKYKVNVYHTDDCWNKIIPDDPMNVNKRDMIKYGDKYRKCIEALLNKKEKCIIEGLGILEYPYLYKNRYSKMIETYPSVIVGSSMFKSSIQAIKDPKRKSKIIHTLKTNIKVMDMYNKFRKNRIKVGNDIKELR